MGLWLAATHQGECRSFLAQSQRLWLLFLVSLWSFTRITETSCVAPDTTGTV